MENEISKRLMHAMSQFRRLKRGHKHTSQLKPSDMMLLTKMLEMDAAGEELSASTLSAAMEVSRPFVTNSIHAFVEAGIVERTTDQSDRRSAVLSITPKGKELIEDAKKEFMASIDGLVAHLGSEKSQMLADLMCETYQYLAHVHEEEHSC